MKYYLTPLFPLFMLAFSPAVRAQGGPPPPNARVATSTGTMVASVDNREIHVAISSAAGYEEYRFVDKQRAENSPQQYEFHTTYNRLNHFDLTPVHQLIDYLTKRGWRLTSTTHSSPEMDRWDGSRADRFIYHFAITVPEVSDETPEEVAVIIEPRISTTARADTRASLVRLPDGRPRLRIEQREGFVWLTAFELVDEGAIAGDQLERISSIFVAPDYLDIEYTFDNGIYRYRFVPNTRGGYELSEMGRNQQPGCGIVRYSLKFNSESTARVTGFRRPQNCTGTESLRSFSEEITVRPVTLSNFSAGLQRLEIKKTGEELIF